MTDTVRLSLKVPPDVADTLKAIAAERSTTVTQVVRDAVELERILQAAKALGDRLMLVAEDGSQREVILQ